MQTSGIAVDGVIYNPRKLGESHGVDLALTSGLHTTKSRRPRVECGPDILVLTVPMYQHGDAAESSVCAEFQGWVFQELREEVQRDGKVVFDTVENLIRIVLVLDRAPRNNEELAAVGARIVSVLAAKGVNAKVSERDFTLKANGTRLSGFYVRVDESEPLPEAPAPRNVSPEQSLASAEQVRLSTTTERDPFAPIDVENGRVQYPAPTLTTEEKLGAALADIEELKARFATLEVSAVAPTLGKIVPAKPKADGGRPS
jgi:hypothetical protein